MLKNIRLHINKDEEQQKQLEEIHAPTLQKRHKDNSNAFQRYIPSLMHFVKSAQSSNISLFCNKHGRFNIVDYGTGRVFYDDNPEQESFKQVQQFSEHAHYIAFTKNKNDSSEFEQGQLDSNLLSASPNLEKLLTFPKLPDSVDCLVIMGIGLGFHIERLLHICKFRFVIIYEPEIQYFSASTMILDWKSILRTAQERNITLFFMLGKDGRDLASNIEELRDNFTIDGFYFYRHYNHPVFNSIQQQLLTRDWTHIRKNGFHFNSLNDSNFYNIYSPSNNLKNYSLAERSDPVFQKNIEAFKVFFPDIAKKFENFKPLQWLPVKSENNQINMLNKVDLNFWYSEEPIKDSDVSFQGFSEHPNKDGLILGYSGKKLAHYTHYKFVKEAEKLLEETENEKGCLPENIKSLIIFGLGAGYQLEPLSKNHNLEKLFICEPNPDFFYASLFAIDWREIFKSVNNEHGKLYINIGDDGTNLFRDLLGQFYSVGPYLLNNTYFYQSYFNSSLNMAAAKLREQLQIVIAMGEYFDHAYYGIAQTKVALGREYPHLINAPAKQFSFEEREVPVFVVGNGPSLDYSLEAIKEWQDKAIIVSCGTALQVMYKNGIVPDYHAEIEQNRSNFDWACMLGDFDYLKKIPLLSCNGAHPDTCDLYKEVFIAFKEGESSTVSSLEVIGEDNYSLLQYAFPTVTNFTCDLFSTIGFRNIYLIGVDMGFIDNKRHHSKQSAYYKEDGKETYDYSNLINTSIVVPGNFRKTVFTKHEFKVAKLTLEQAISASPKDVNFFNCSDGAMIFGAAPLEPHSVLSTVTAEDKRSAITTMKIKAYKQLNGKNIIEKIDNKYSYHLLQKDLSAFSELLSEKVESFECAEKLVEKQKRLLFSSYQDGNSMLFYYLHGTVNFANATLTKLLYSSNDSGVQQFQNGLNIWKTYFEQFRNKLSQDLNAFDVSISPHAILDRTYKVLQHRFSNKKIAIVTNSQGYVDSINYFYSQFIKLPLSNIMYFTPKTISHQAEKEFDFVIYNYVKEFNSPCCDSPKEVVNAVSIQGKEGTLFVDHCLNRNDIEQILSLNPTLKILKVTNDPRSFENFEWICDLARIALSSLSVVIETSYHVVMLKYPVLETCDMEIFAQSNTFTTKSNDIIYSHDRNVCIDLFGEHKADGLMAIGDRGTKLEDLETIHDFVDFEISAERFKETQIRMHKILPTVLKDRELQ